jgi:hypothetical protein
MRSSQRQPRPDWSPTFASLTQRFSLLSVTPGLITPTTPRSSARLSCQPSVVQLPISGCTMTAASTRTVPHTLPVHSSPPPISWVLPRLGPIPLLEARLLSPAKQPSSVLSTGELRASAASNRPSAPDLPHQLPLGTGRKVWTTGKEDAEAGQAQHDRYQLVE